MEKLDHGFKKKTITKIIKSKINQWLNTIDNEELKEKIRSNYILTGGAICSMLQGETPNDFDIYFKDQDVCLHVANYYLSKIEKKSDLVGYIQAKPVDGHVRIMIKSAGIVEGVDGLDGYRFFELCPPEELDKYMDKDILKKKEKYSVSLISTNAISLNDGIQIVTRFVGEPDAIHHNYDFIHTTNYYTERTGLVLNQPALESIISKEIRYVGSLYPVCSMFRLKKFIKRGWSVTAGEMLKIAFDISKLDLSRPEVLREQLVGVDYAYFSQILSILNSGSREIDRTYLAEVINKVFDKVDDHEQDALENIIKNEVKL
jgi:hypothetical protein